MNANSTLAATACWTAAVRARESRREDRLFRDPWAEALAGEQGASWIIQRPEDSTTTIALRTRYFDDFLEQISSLDEIRQVVLLAAGFDTRAFRLKWPAGVCVFEMDQPSVMDYKESVLQSLGATAVCERRIIRKDLAGSWREALVETGFDPARPSCFLLEGFLFYLSNETETEIIDSVTLLSAPGTRLGFDVMNSAMLTSSYTKAWVEMQAQSGAPWIGTMDDPESFLSSRGWIAALTQAGQPEANHGRWKLPVFPTKATNFPHNWWVTAVKKV
jgi:methyltransferase (TIGR00027 family)